MAVLYTPHFVQFLDTNGNPLSGGRLFTYEAGTTTPKATYTTEDASVSNANPVVLDSSGRATIFIDGSYKFRLETSAGALVRETDNVSSFETANAAAGVINWATADSLASASTVNIGAASSNYVVITGTTPITAFDSIAQGAERLLRFNGSLTLTHNATTLILPSGQNIVTSAGDIARFISEGSGNWRLTSYQSSGAVNVLRNHIDGFQMSTAGASTTMTIGAGQAANSTNSIYITQAASISKTTGAWSVGSGNGGIDAGTVANNTWYHFYAIRRPDTGVVDDIFSLAPNTSSVITVTIASPGVVTWNAHGLTAGTPIKFTTTGALPTGITAGTQYYVIASGLSTNTFQFSTSIGGAAVNTTGTQSGTHTCLAEPILPANYTQFRRIGSGLTNGSAQWVRFVQNGNRFMWDAAVLDITDAATGTAAKTGTLPSVPTGVSVLALLQAFIASNGVYVHLSPLSVSDQAPATSSAPLAFMGAGTSADTTGNNEVITNTTQQIRYRTNINDTLRIATLGWVDSRGRE